MIDGKLDIKRTIRGRRYDTRAHRTTCVAAYDNELPQSHPRAIREELYRTSSGSFFLAGRGGEMTCWYHVTSFAERIGGDGIRGMSRPAAIDWLVRSSNFDALRECFPGPWVVAFEMRDGSSVTEEYPSITEAWRRIDEDVLACVWILSYHGEILLQHTND